MGSDLVHKRIGWHVVWEAIRGFRSSLGARISAREACEGFNFRTTDGTQYARSKALRNTWISQLIHLSFNPEAYLLKPVPVLACSRMHTVHSFHHQVPSEYSMPFLVSQYLARLAS